MADGTAAAPRLQELLQRLAGGGSSVSVAPPPPHSVPTSPQEAPASALHPQQEHSLGVRSLTCTRSGRRWLSMARYPSRLCSMGICDTAELPSPSADRHHPAGQEARGQEGPGSQAQFPPHWHPHRAAVLEEQQLLRHHKLGLLALCHQVPQQPREDLRPVRRGRVRGKSRTLNSRDPC